MYVIYIEQYVKQTASVLKITTRSNYHIYDSFKSTRY